MPHALNLNLSLNLFYRASGQETMVKIQEVTNYMYSEYNIVF